MKNILRYKYLYLMLVPVIIWYIIFCYVPMYGIVISFQNYSMTKGVFGSQFVGLKHFIDLFKDYGFVNAFRNTFIIAAFRILVEFPIPIIIALMLTSISNKHMQKFIQTIIYLPHFISWVIVASIILMIFNPESGLMKAVTDLIGVEYTNILIRPKNFRALLIISDLWKESGWNTIIYVAAISGIDPTLYEAAEIDGASKFQKTIHITLAGIRSVVVIMLILWVGTVLTWGFDQVYNLYSSMVYETGDIIDTYIFRTALSDMKFSFAAAAGFINSLICLVFLTMTNKIAKLMGEESIY